MDDYDRDLGPCCGCKATGPTVRNLVCLGVKGPVAGTGWGCVVCGLPSDGALAVMCDSCMEAKSEPLEVIAGYVAEIGRTPRASCTEPFEHDMDQHQDESDG
jgi:hypothetical protein